MQWNNSENFSILLGKYFELDEEKRKIAIEHQNVAGQTCTSPITSLRIACSLPAIMFAASTLPSYVKQILPLKPDVTKLDNQLRSALHIAAWKGIASRHSHLFDFLINSVASEGGAETISYLAEYVGGGENLPHNEFDCISSTSHHPSLELF